MEPSLSEMAKFLAISSSLWTKRKIWAKVTKKSRQTLSEITKILWAWSTSTFRSTFETLLYNYHTCRLAADQEIAWTLILLISLTKKKLYLSYSQWIQIRRWTMNRFWAALTKQWKEECFMACIKLFLAASMANVDSANTVWKEWNWKFFFIQYEQT